MLLSILYIYTQVGSTDYETLLTFSFSRLEQKILWFSFFIAFASKVPMLPVHLWLPEAHVEAECRLDTKKTIESHDLNNCIY